MTLAGQAPAGQGVVSWAVDERAPSRAYGYGGKASPAKFSIVPADPARRHQVVAHMAVRADGGNVAQAREYAHLIASSPSLLQAAQDAYLQMLRVNDQRTRVTLSYQGALCQLRDSIAAATGRDSQAVQEEYEARATGSQP